MDKLITLQHIHVYIYIYTYIHTYKSLVGISAPKRKYLGPHPPHRHSPSALPPPAPPPRNPPPSTFIKSRPPSPVSRNRKNEKYPKRPPRKFGAQKSQVPWGPKAHTLLVSPDFRTPATCGFSHAIQGKGHYQGKTLDKGHLPFIAWKKSHVAGGRKLGLTNQCAFGPQEWFWLSHLGNMYNSAA